MSSGGVNRSSAGGGDNTQLGVAGTNANNLNTQLQSILGQYSSSPIAGSGGSAAGTFNNIAATGGYTPTQISSIEDQSAAGAQSAYSTASDAYNRASAASGGYGPSGAITNSLARAGSQAGASSAQNAAGTIAQNQVNNQLSAANGLTSLAGLSSQQIQNIFSTILGNYSSLNSAQNQTLGINAGIAETPGTATLGLQNATGLISALNQ